MEEQNWKKRLETFIKGLEGKKTALVFHRDPDGLCSGLITAKTVEKIRSEKPEFFHSMEYDELEKISKVLIGEKAERIIFTDLSVDSQSDEIRKLEKTAQILIIDHHKVYENLNSEKTIFIKASEISEIEPSKYPASKMCFDIFSQYAGLEKDMWIACIGILGDMGLNQWESFFGLTFEQNSTTLKELKELTKMINAVETVCPENFELLFTEFFDSPGPGNVSRHQFWEHVETLEAEAEKWAQEFDLKAERFPKIELIFFEIKPEYDVKSYLINELSQKNPDKTLIIMQNLGKGTVTVSARRQDFKVRVNDLLEKATKGIEDAGGGGHIPAAGGHVPEENLEQFKQNIIDILRGKNDRFK